MLHAGNRKQGYSFGWTNGGAEDTLGFHGGHTLLQPLYGQGGTGAGTGGEVYAMDLRHCLGEGGTACPDKTRRFFPFAGVVEEPPFQRPFHSLFCEGVRH